MKKFFTLIAMAAMTLAASAQTLNWSAGAKTSLAAGDNLVDNAYATATAALNSDAVAGKQFLDEDNNPVSKTINGVTFKYFVPTRVTDLPAAANEYQGTEAEGCIAVNIEAKQNTDVQIYTRIGSTKSITLYDATEKTAAGLKNSFEETDGDNLLVVAVGQLQKGHKYVLCMKGGTMALCGLNFVDGTYVEPSSKLYGFNTATNLSTYGDGAKMQITGNTEKAFGSAASIKGISSIKNSNGAQNTFTAPAGKVVKSVTFYFAANKDDEEGKLTEINGEKEEFASALGKIHAEPAEYTYKFTTPASSFTFTFSNKQVNFILDVELADASAAPTVKQQATEAVKTIKKAGANGLEIISGAAIYNVAGQQK